MRLSFLSTTLVVGIVAGACCLQAQAQGPGPGQPGAGNFAQPGAAAPAYQPQQPAAASGPTTMRVIDVATVFKKHNRFNAAMNDIKKDIEAFDTFVRSEQKRMQGLAEQLQSFKTGSIEYKQKEEEIAKLSSDMQVKIGLKRKEFLEQEARVYFYVYREIEQSVNNHALRNRIGLVLRFNGDEMKEDDRASVLQGVNRAVVFHDPSMNITELILQDLNRGPSVTPTAQPPRTGPAGGTATRPNVPQPTQQR